MNIFKRKKEVSKLPEDIDVVDAKATFYLDDKTEYTRTEEGSYFIHCNEVYVRDAASHLRSIIGTASTFITTDDNSMIPVKNINRVQITETKRTVKVVEL